jgi:hypothetical protein
LSKPRIPIFTTSGLDSKLVTGFTVTTTFSNEFRESACVERVTTGKGNDLNLRDKYPFKNQQPYKTEQEKGPAFTRIQEMKQKNDKYDTILTGLLTSFATRIKNVDKSRTRRPSAELYRCSESTKIQ